MAYDEDIIEKPTSKPSLVSEEGCFAFTLIAMLLMIIIGLPSLYTYYTDPLPGIVLFGMLALILSILYLATIVKKLVENK